jgi:O-antigen/teichoic acid export membrane protein
MSPAPGPAERRGNTEASELKRKTFGSVVWTVARIGTDQVSAFLVFVFLARLLTPHDMGLFALALAFLELGRLVATGGFPEAVIREERLDRDLLDTVFWANLGFALLTLGALYLAAPGLARFFGEPELEPVLATIGGVIPLSALGSVHTACTLREFGHKSMAGRALAAGLVGGGLGVYGAFSGWGVWSLLAQRFAMEGVSTLLSWTAYPWLPGFRFSRRRLRSVLRFSGNMMLTQVLWMAMVRCQDVIIGRLMTAAAVGVYRVSWRAADLLTQFTIGPFSTAALPTLSRLQADREGFGRACIRLLSVTGLVAFPSMLGFGAIAPVAVPWVFGRQWAEAGEVAQLLSLMAVPAVLSTLFSPALAALGHSGKIVRVAALQLALSIGFVAAAAPFGLAAVAGAYVARAYLTLPVQLWLLRRQAGLSLRRVAAAVVPSLAAAALMAAGLLQAHPFLVERFGDGPRYLLAAIGAGALIYALLLLMFARRLVAGNVSAFRSTIAGK